LRKEAGGSIKNEKSDEASGAQEKGKKKLAAHRELGKKKKMK